MAKLWNFRGVGGVRPDHLEQKIQGGGGSNWKNPPWGVWIFSGTTHSLILLSSYIKLIENYVLVKFYLLHITVP